MTLLFKKFFPIAVYQNIGSIFVDVPIRYDVYLSEWLFRNDIMYWQYKYYHWLYHTSYLKKKKIIRSTTRTGKL